ncbi:MAG: hypothetical protein MZU97_18515 [Bacillus subtilis]|nr:hypothetical protein [Bacillus subtilis]
MAPVLVFFLPFLEAIIPSLPLTVIIAFSLLTLYSLYGIVWGTLWTIVLATLGSFFGMVLIFVLIRKVIKPVVSAKHHNNPVGRKFMRVVDEQNDFVLFSFWQTHFFLPRFSIIFSPLHQSNPFDTCS